MARVLLLNPNRWGRGITAIWIASHAAVLKSRGHEPALFDCTFHRDWRHDEVAYNTRNSQYRPSLYDRYIKLNDTSVYQDLEARVHAFKPDIVFWAALSSHIHGEGEYVNIQYGHELLQRITLPAGALKIAGGLQPTAAPSAMYERFPGIDYFIGGESEFVLADLADRLGDDQGFRATAGLIYRRDGRVIVNPRQPIIADLDAIPPYDYSVFDDQVFFRPYNGNVVRAVDYEMSRGCVYTCSYCVETVIQRYYGFEERNDRGMLRSARGYLRHKSARRVFEEIEDLHRRYGIELFRCQDTNFLTIDRGMLHELADYLERADLKIKLYVETRPDGITRDGVELLKRLRVDGVGMGIELAAEGFRESKLRRYSSRERIIKAFRLLREAGIRRTAYNIIGLPEEDEAMVLETIRFNQLLFPDNVTVAYYSPYLGTEQQAKGAVLQDFNDYEYDLDAQLRTLSRATRLGKELLEFYKKYFVRLVREGLDRLDDFKRAEGVNG